MVLANLLQPLIFVEEWILERMHELGLGWGLAIVGLTLLVRVCTVPLVLRQFHLQRQLREHMPEMKRLQQRHKDDRALLQREMKKYYAEHGVNPLSSFAPLLVQIPIFISLYYLMRTDVENGLFGDAGFLFVPHLTDRPEGAVLVALVLTYLTSQVTGSLIATRSMQGGQRGLILALPLLFVGLVARFPAGLAVYWITTSLWTLGQQVVLWRLTPEGMPPAAVAIADPVATTEPKRAPPAPGAARKHKRKHGRR